MAEKVDFGADMRQAEESGVVGGGGFYKLKEGGNRIRLLSRCLPHQNEYDGKKNFKWLCYVLDRRDGEVKAFFMAHRIYKNIVALQTDPDYTFETVPMPYDLTIHAKGAGTKEVEYSLLPSPRQSALTPDELEKLDAAKPIAELQQAIKDKQDKGKPASSQARSSEQANDGGNRGPDADGDLADSDIPFAWIMPLILPAIGLLSVGILA